MGSVIDLYERKDNNSNNKIVTCSILGCTNQPAKQCNICSNNFCYKHIKSHIHTNEFPNIK
jgi:predicted nucleic acid binding AN1-type Zn finger protein